MHKYSRCLETKSFSFSCTEIFNLSLSQKTPKNKTKPQAHPLTHKHLTSRAKHTFNLPWTYFQTVSHKESARSVLSYRKEVPTFSYKCSTSQTKKPSLGQKKRLNLSFSQMFISFHTQKFKCSNKCSNPLLYKTSNSLTNIQHRSHTETLAQRLIRLAHTSSKPHTNVQLLMCTNVKVPKQAHRYLNSPMHSQPPLHGFTYCG